MAKLLNADYWKKAYLLEFKLNGVLTDAFTFSVPPENEDFSFPQRKNETKTFGGSVVADYGNDLVQINLSGSTINQELKLIYKARLGNEKMTGEQEIFYLRDLLKKYGKRENLKGKEIYLYSLNGGGDVPNNPKWWKIYVGQLDISRSKDKPFCYNYKFNATGEPEVNSIRSKISDKISTIRSITQWFESIIGEGGLLYQINTAIDKLYEYGGNLLSDVSSAIRACSSAVDYFNETLTKYTDVTNGIIKGIGDIATDSVMLADKIVYSAIRIYPTIEDNVWNSVLVLKESCNNLYNVCASLKDKYFNDEDSSGSGGGGSEDNTYSSSSWQLVRELFDDTVSDQDIADVFETLAHEALKSADKSVEITSKNLNELSFSVVPGDTDENDKVVFTYGYKVITTTEAETNWDQLAQDYYGDSSLSYIIAMYNNLPSDKPLEIGQSIVIPKLIFAESRIADNEIYNTPDVKDNYGKDILIKDKDFAVYNGDLQLITGIDNLEQALLNRYSTLVGARIRLEVYGIQASIGDALNASSSLIQASVHQTTVEDPRVESVESVNFNGMGDELAVSVIYVDKNGTKQNFGGVV